MKNLVHILSFEWKNLWRSHTLKLLLLVFLGAGVYGIYFGKFEIEKQDTRIAQVEQHVRARFDSLLLWAQLDTAIEANKKKYQQAFSPEGVGWTLHFSYLKSNEASPTAGLCLGQRDLYPVYYRVNLTDIGGQINIGELANPMKLLTGNFDLSYVYVFLLPLLLISLFHNLYAFEKEGGTISLLQAQPVSLNLILFGKGFLRLMMVWGSSILLLLLGFFMQGVSLLENTDLFFQWFFAISAYTFFWAFLMAGIVALRQGTALSAMLGLGVWLIFILITPTLLNLFVSASHPLPNRTEATHIRRTLNGKIWDSPKSFVFNRFYKEHPQFAQNDTTHFYKWYYASFALLDSEINTLQAKYEAQVNQRNALLERWKWLAPAAMVHEYLSSISKTDRQSQLEFIKAVHAYHGELKALYYQRIFDEKQFSMQDLKALEKKL